MLVGEKGQVTIPKPLRDALGLASGCEVSFELRGDTLVLRKSGRGRGGAIVAGLRGRGDVAMTTDEIMALTRDG